MNSRATSVLAWRLHRSAIAACLVYLRKIARTAFWEFCNTIGTNRRLEVGQSMSALPGYLRHVWAVAVALLRSLCPYSKALVSGSCLLDLASSSSTVTEDKEYVPLAKASESRQLWSHCGPRVRPSDERPIAIDPYQKSRLLTDVAAISQNIEVAKHVLH